MRRRNVTGVVIGFMSACALVLACSSSSTTATPAAEAGACPTTPPKTGDACSAKQTCQFGCESTPGTASCDGSKWTFMALGTVCLDAATD
jgi:hypothetical protein